MIDYMEYEVEIKNGTWYAYRLRSPYFCFTADSREELEKKLKRAKKFYGKWQDGRVDDCGALLKR